MTKLPDGWEIKRLDEIADIVMGQSPPGSSYNENGEGQPFFQGKTEFGDVHPTVRKYTTAGTKFAKAGDILMSVRAPVGPTNIADIDCVIGRGLAAIRAKTVVSQSYLRWSLKHLEIDIQSKGTGTTFDAITGETLRGTFVALPPMAEQQKIVELLEDHLSRINAALADVYCAKSKSSQLKLAILSKVFKGEFFEFELPVLCINDVAKVMNGDRGKNYPNKSSRVESGVAFINAGHLDNDLLNIEEMDFISEERFNLLAAGKIELNDLLFCLRGSLGKVAINDKFTNGAIASSLAILRVGPKVLPKYLYYYFLSPLAAAEIRKHDNGTAQPNLSAANLRRFEVPIPTIEQQKIVIDFLDSELSRTIQASHTFTSLFFIASAMRRSLLQAAFTGQLTKEVVSV